MTSIRTREQMMEFKGRRRKTHLAHSPLRELIYRAVPPDLVAERTERYVRQTLLRQVECPVERYALLRVVQVGMPQVDVVQRREHAALLLVVVVARVPYYGLGQRTRTERGHGER